MSVDTTELRDITTFDCIEPAFKKLINDAADEIEQLRRLVCSGWRVRLANEEDSDPTAIWLEHTLRPIKIFTTQQAAIDAAIKHMEENDAK